MHEAAIADELLSLLMDQAKKHNMSRVTGLSLRIGLARQVIPDFLSTAFEALSRGTLAQGAQMQIETVPLVAKCDICQREVTCSDPLCVCPVCDAVLTQIISGRELDLVELTGEEQVSPSSTS